MDVKEFNRIALTPEHTVVVEACAGSGKTWLLVSRIVRLLLDGVAPSEILAITFTRKAAREMQARLDEWLRLCATAEDDVVRQFLRERAVDESQLEVKLTQARGLFEAVLTAQPGVTISTFHAWFLDVIQRAPLSSGLMGLELAEQTRPYQNQAWAQLTQAWMREPDAATAVAMQTLIAQLGLFNTRKLLNNFIHRRSEWWAYTMGEADPWGYAMTQLQDEIGVDADADIAAELLADTQFIADLYEYARLLGLNTATTQKRADAIITLLGATLTTEQRYHQLHSTVLSAKGEMYSLKASAAQEKRLGAAVQDSMISLHERIGTRLIDAHQLRLAQASYHFNANALRVGAALLTQYQQVKREARVLDFADVEWQVAQLLANSDDAEYIQMKLDARYQQILLDEFQDTNPIQWQILQAWFESARTSHVIPKVFLVGDPKQSIYRFRGAEAGLFDLAREYLQLHGSAHYLQQNNTRRSSHAIITGLNASFEPIADYPLFHEHGVYETVRPGRIEVLPLVSTPETDGSGGQSVRNPLQQSRREENEVHARQIEAQQLAARILDMVHHWVIDDTHNGEQITRRVRFADIMILVRSRTQLHHYEQALTAAHIPYASASRTGLLESMEAQDVLSLLQWLSTPYLDLPLAQVLRSPIFACNDDDLIQLRLARTSTATWWETLRQQASTPALASAAELLSSWLEYANVLPVHDVLDRIYFQSNLIARYQAVVPAAMVKQVTSNLTELLALALSLSGGRYPSLARFLHDIKQLSGDSESAPEEGLSDVGDTVTIHTIHGAKGLEAPIVWLLDAGARQAPADTYRVLLDWPLGAARPGHFSLMTTQAEVAGYQQPYLAQDALHQQREDYNLLYVAMTRARQVLMVSGVASRRSGGWHQLIGSGLGANAEESANPVIHGDSFINRSLSTAPISPVAANVRLPDEMRQAYPIGQRIVTDDTPATLFGKLVHMLLAEFAPPQFSSDDLLRARFGLHAEFDRALQHARHIIQQPQLQRFFNPQQYQQAHNEYAYLRADGSTHRIDRLVVFTTEVWILDYKTDQIEDVDTLIKRHREQLGEYCGAMQSCYPKYSINGGLITLAGELVVI
ncbi:MAG: UvrD-helicase domain-containing protein [Sulfuriferula sp.]